MQNAWLNRKPFVVSEETYRAFRQLRKRFHCSLCGKELGPGDSARWIYANSTPGQTTGNFFVCGKCDDVQDEAILKKARESLATATKLAKQWGIYGPDWESH